MVLKPGREPMAEAIFRKWELDFAVIGRSPTPAAWCWTWNGETVCDIPLGPLADEAPLYDRPHVPPPGRLQPWAERSRSATSRIADIAADLLTLMGSPRHRLAALDLGAVRPAGRRRHACSARAATPRWCASTARTRRSR